MLLAMIGVIVFTAVAAIMIASRREGSLAGHAFASPVRGSSPLDEAERILARRYARGEITAEEYDRMLVIVRR